MGKSEREDYIVREDVRLAPKQKDGSRRKTFASGFSRS
jgi:hypothetical protein